MKATTEAAGWAQARLDHPRIPLLIAVDEDGALAEIRFDAERSEPTPSGDRSKLAETPSAAALAGIRGATAQLQEYFAGERQVFELVLRPQGTDFQRRAWSALMAIPFGETRTYGQQAALLGDPKASRAVGRANSLNPLPIVVPCHRVIGSSGQLTGFAGGLERKRWLLDHEASRAQLELLGDL